MVSVVRGAAQYFYRVDRGAAELLASRPARVGLLVPFHVEEKHHTLYHTVA